MHVLDMNMIVWYVVLNLLYVPILVSSEIYWLKGKENPWF